VPTILFSVTYIDPPLIVFGVPDQTPDQVESKTSA